MIRLLNVYYPTRALILLFCEALLVGGSFVVATAYLVGPDSYIALVYDNGILKICGIAAFALLLSYYFDLYEPQRISERWEIYFRLLLVLSFLSFTLAAVVYIVPTIEIGPNVLVVGTCILAIALIAWRRAYGWIIGLRWFRERVYVLGNGEMAQEVIQTLHRRRDAGMEPVNTEGNDNLMEVLLQFAGRRADSHPPKQRIDRIIVAMEDRRGTMPVRDLLNLRLQGVQVEDAGHVMEKLTGRLPLKGLNPSSLIFSDGFNAKTALQIERRLLSIIVASIGLIVSLPFIPFIIVAVRLSSPGPVFFSQTRVGRGGRPFVLRKFRTMWRDAETSGAVWAASNDPRVTPLGSFMRKTRLDEIPQLWNVLRGDMSFVGPRPERPEFVRWLKDEIPYYDLRHMIRPGITGWAQVRYKYGASLEETRRKLEYDLYYVKHLSLGLDLLILFETIKTILTQRGAQ
jgi:sugar transferase (PEP-CTERM system associated)